MSAVLTCWFEPIEESLRTAQPAREGLIAGGDLVYAGHSYHEAVYYQLECAPSLDVYAADVEAGLAFLRQTGEPAGTRAMFILAGLAAIAFGVVLCARPGIGAVTLALLFGLFNLIGGIWMLGQGIELRRTGKTVHSVRLAKPGTPEKKAA